VVNARVWTGAARRPWADAVVVRGDRIALVGGSAEARKLAAGAPGARVVDAQGRTVVARLDAHELGTLAAGGRADFVLADRDPVSLAPEARGAVRAVLTVDGGRVTGAAADGAAADGAPA
jgi:predicted amidohydrolase YtcJ